MWYNEGMNSRLLRVLIILIPVVIIIALTALIFVVVVILNPDWEWTKNYPYIRETVAATSTAAMVVATLFLAWATFTVINNDRQREERERKERILNEIIEWVSVLKLRTLQANRQITVLQKKQGYEGLFFAISDELVKAELMKLRASENAIPVEKELKDVWQDAFFCSQLALRMAGGKPTEEQRKRWSKDALDVVTRIDQLEKQGNLTDQEMYNGKRDLMEKISSCFKKLAEVEATL